MAIEHVDVGPRGTFEASGNEASTPAQVDALFAHLRATDAKAITLHFHGGLISERSGMQIAAKMAPVYRAADNYPLTFVWETGLIEAFRDNLADIHRTKLFKKLLVWVLKRTAKRFGGFDGRGAGQPVSQLEIEAELQKDFPFEGYDDTAGRGAARGAGIAVSEQDLVGLEDELVEEFQGDVQDDEEIEALLTERNATASDPRARGLFTGITTAKRLATIAYRVIKRHVRDRDHGFYPTVVEELLREFYLADLGAWVWTQMKDKALDMWRSNRWRTGEEQRVGSYILDKIAELQEERPDFVLNLVGHSAGSIAICHMFEKVAARQIAINVKHVVLLAPAARSELGAEYLAAHPERYESLRVFTMADRYERKDALVKGIYTRSLLYFIAGVLEPDEVDAPLMGLARHATGEGPYQGGATQAWGDFMKDAERLVLSDSAELDPDAPEGRRSSSRSHGDFDDDVPNRASLTHLLKV